jgi:hypothetical protein
MFSAMRYVDVSVHVPQLRQWKFLTNEVDGLEDRTTSTMMKHVDASVHVLQFRQ